MAKFSQFDRNRYNKKYSFVRAPAKLFQISDQQLEIEVLRIQFNQDTEKTVSFEAPFADATYKAVVSSRQTTSEDSAHVVLHIDGDSSSATQITVVASAPFTGEVDVIAVRVA